MGRDKSDSPRRRRRDDDTYSRGESTDGDRHRQKRRHRNGEGHVGEPERRHRDKRRSRRDDDDDDDARSDQDRRNRRGGHDSQHKDKGRRKLEEREEKEESDEDLLDLRALGVAEISEEDYFLMSAEFKYWLKEERERYLDELSSESAHKYFRKFVRRWNDGALKGKFYRPPPTSSSSANTAYKWSFASNPSAVDPVQLASIRTEVDRSTHAQATFASRTSGNRQEKDVDDDIGIGPSLSPRPGSRRLGPALPSTSDRQLALESASELRKRDRKAEQRERYEKADEAVPRSGGKEGKMDEKRATNAVNREFREKEVGGLEVDEGTLMGESSFQAALRARDASKNRREDKRAIEMADRRAATDERLADRRAKESATMDMFKALAKQRFG